MGVVLVLAPVIIGSWPVITAAVVAAQGIGLIRLLAALNGAREA